METRSIKAVLRRFGLLGGVRLASQLAGTEGRKRLVRDWQALRNMRRQFGDGLTRPPRSPNRIVLVIGQTSIAEITLQSPLITAFRLAGYRPVVVLDSRELLAEAAYRAIGVDLFAFHEDHLPTACDTPAITRGIPLEELLAMSYCGVTVGRYAVARLMRSLRNGDPDLSGEHIDKAHAAIAQACAYTDSVRTIIAAHRPSAALFLDHGYSPEGQLFDLVLDHGGTCFTWNAAHRDGMLMLKRYGPGNRDVHPSSLSAPTWQRLRDMRWTEGHWRTLRREIEDCYHAGHWFGEVGTQFHKRFPAPEALKAELGLDPAKNTAVIFPHIFWDATFFWGTDLFRNYEHWFVESLKAACANDRLNWIVKVHPGNMVKDRRDGYQGEHSEISAIRAAVGALPSHIRLIDASADIGTLSLYHVLDYCVTVRGTVGIEAAAFGKRVVTAGTGRYDRRGFTADPESADAYLDTLSRLETLAPLNAAETELARRYAYGVFVVRPFQLESIHFAYAQDETASLDVCGKAHCADLWTATDVTTMASWIESGDEDFLREDVMVEPVDSLISATSPGIVS